MLRFGATAQNVQNSNSVVFSSISKILNGVSHLKEDRYEQAVCFTEFVSLLAFKRAIARQNPSTRSKIGSLAQGGGRQRKFFLSDCVQIHHTDAELHAESESGLRFHIRYFVLVLQPKTTKILTLSFFRKMLKIFSLRLT